MILDNAVRALLAFVIASAMANTLMLHAIEIRLAWDPNTEPEVVGYRIHYGELPGALDQRADAGNATTVIIGNLSPGKTYAFHATAYSTFGLESDPSQAVLYTVPIPGNLEPIAQPQLVTTTQDTPVDMELTGIDVQGETLAFEVVTEPVHGRLSGIAPHLTYTPKGSYIGADDFSFRVSDGETDSAPAIVLLMITPVAEASPVRITGVEPTAQGVKLSWVSIPGKEYRVVYKERLSDPEWRSLGEPIPAIGSLMVYVDPVVEEGVAVRYYAVEQLENR
jgi:hypothetical protein